MWHYSWNDDRVMYINHAHTTLMVCALQDQFLSVVAFFKKRLTKFHPNFGVFAEKSRVFSSSNCMVHIAFLMFTKGYFFYDLHTFLLGFSTPFTLFTCMTPLQLASNEWVSSVQCVDQAMQSRGTLHENAPKRIPCTFWILNIILYIQHSQKAWCSELACS